MKMRFDSITSNRFLSFKLVPKKRKDVNADKKVSNNLVKGICIEEDGKFKVKVNIRNVKADLLGNNYPDIIVLEFTEESYNLKGVTSVFSRNADENGKHHRYIRSESDAKFMFGDPNRYIPFCPNWTCSGYIIKRDGKLLFDFNDCQYESKYV